MIRGRACALALLLLGGCMDAPTAGTATFRDAHAPISSTTRFDKTRFAGTWNVTARMATAQDAYATAPERFEIDTRGHVVHQTMSCNDFECVFPQSQTTMKFTGPGRFALHGTEHWLLWVDDDFRTAVIGSPSGAFGWVMEKTRKTTPRDRMTAAREILGWAGYDLAQLRQVTP